MSEIIKAITLNLPYKLGKVNCYLVETNIGFVLIDTGSSNKQNYLQKELEYAGCKPGKLKIIILTHGDFDHSGNAAYLRKKYGATVAMQKADSGMVEWGNMFSNRNKGNIFIKTIAPLLFGFGKSKRFSPDIYLNEGHDLSEYGLKARVLGLPGHSKGSLGILTDGGDLFCGDLLVNRNKPSLNAIIDEPDAANSSIIKLKALKINTVYPGHGNPFSMESFIKNNH